MALRPMIRKDNGYGTVRTDDLPTQQSQIAQLYRKRVFPWFQLELFRDCTSNSARGFDP